MIPVTGKVYIFIESYISLKSCIDSLIRCQAKPAGIRANMIPMTGINITRHIAIPINNIIIISLILPPTIFYNFSK